MPSHWLGPRILGLRRRSPCASSARMVPQSPEESALVQDDPEFRARSAVPSSACDARFDWSTAGESHGPGAPSRSSEGIPAGLPLLEADVDEDLRRRQRGYGRGGRMKIETDRARLVAGVRGGETLGSPIAITIENRDHANWAGRMGSGALRRSRRSLLTRPRPGHADLSGGIKYDRDDLRDILERASARETAAARRRRRRLPQAPRGARRRRLRPRRGHRARGGRRRRGRAPEDLRERVREVFGPRLRRSRRRSRRCRAAILEAAHAGDTLGGVFEVVATGGAAGAPGATCTGTESSMGVSPRR